MEKPSAFLPLLALQLRRCRRSALGLLAMAVLALLLAGAVGLGVGGLFAGQGFDGMRLAVATEDDDPRVAAAFDLLEGTDGLDALAEVLLVTPDEAAALVRSGEISAAVVLPAGFWASVMSGENLPPTLLVDAARPVEMMLAIELAESATRVLTRAQQAVTFTLKAAEGGLLGEADTDKLVRDINLAYGSWVLGKDSMFRPVTAGGAAGIAPGQRTLLCAALYFACLGTTVLYGFYAFGRQGGWLARYKVAGSRLWRYVASQLLGGALALLPFLALLLIGIRLAGGADAGFSAAFLPGLVLVCLGLSCFAFLLCNTGGLASAVTLMFMLASLGLVTSGGLIPRVLLPGPLAALVPFSPIGWAGQALAPLFGGPFSPGAVGLLAAACAGLAALCLLCSHLRERRGAL